jgi:CubicO group peptidase (beta-lactamase class C family)
MKKGISKSVHALALIGWAALSLSLAALPEARADTVDDIVRKQMEKQHIPGVAVAVVKDGKPVKVQGYGLANMELEVAVKPDSVFRVGSVSKQIIATAVMILVNDGKLSLDDKAVKFFEGAPAIWNDITIRHLLTHTSGLVREGSAFNALKAQSDSDLIKSAYGSPLVFKTGDKWQYSNLGYFMLADIVAKVSGKSWPELVKERIFTPLAMSASGTTDIGPVVRNRVDGYVYQNDRYVNAPTLLALRPSGAFVSTINDLLKWNAALDGATLLPQKSLDTMWTPATLNDGKSYPYGFGFEIGKLGSHRRISHGGSLAGFRAEYLRLPDDKVSVIVLTNLDSAMPDTIAVLIAQQYVKDLFPNRTVAKISVADLDALSGSYRFGSGNLTTVAREGNGLRFKAPSIRMDTLLLPASPTVFVSEDDPRTHFEFDKASVPFKVTAFVNDVANNTGTKE